MTITIDEVLVERIRAIATSQGKDPNQYAVAALRSIVEREENENAHWVENLSPEEWSRIAAGVDRGIADADAGRVKPADEIFERLLLSR
jgi:predicted transcriptional regulator